jgi:hypothetical protein
MAREMQFASVFSGATNLTLKSATEAMGELNTATGYVAEYSQDALETQVMLTKQLGLTGEEAAGIYKLSVLTGKSSEKVNDEMVGAFVAARNASKAGVPFKESMAAAAKVSGQLKANLQADPAGIIKAVVATSALGTTLEQTASQGEKLLDFSSSLESELKAELLTGKSLNLERARAAALAGDQVTLAEELNKNIGTYDEFSKMNVLQQKALAESVGLTADQLATQLEKQKLAQKAGKSLAEYTKDEALKAEKRKEIQQKFNDIVEKLQNLIGTIGALLAPVVQLVTFFADKTWVIYTTLGLVALYRLPLMASGFKSMLGTVGGLGKGIMKAFSMDGIKGWFDKVKAGFKGVSSNSSTITSSRGLTLTKKATDGGVEAAEKTSGVADKVKGGNASGFKEKMQNIAEGIKAFGNVKVLFGAVNLIPSSIGLIAMIPGLLGAKLIEQINGEKFQEAMYGIAYGLEAMGTTKVLVGSLALIAASIGLIAMIPGVIGGALLGISGGLIQKGLVALATGLTEFGVAAADPFFWLGIGALAAFNIALIPLGYTLKLMAPAIEAFGKAIKSTFEGIGAIITATADGIATIFTSLQDVDVTKLLSIGPALIGIGVGLASLGVGGVINAVGNFLGGDPIKKLEDLAASGDGLTQTATALQSIAGALMGVSVALASIDVSKLEALDEFSSNQASNAITSAIASPIKAIGEFIGGNDKGVNTGIDLTPMIAAINEVKASIDKLYNKNTSINMDGKKVGSTLVQGSYKTA